MKTKTNVSQFIVSILLALSLALAGFAVAYTMYWNIIEDSRCVVFSSLSFDSPEKIMDVRELYGYESTYSQYNSYVYYETLDETERKLYKVFEYSLDNAYPYILIDNRIVEECCSRYSLKDILIMLSLDSPIVEQNLLCNDRFSISTKFSSVSGKAVYIENFTSERLEKKNEAINAATEIANSIASNYETEAERAKGIFDYLVTSIAYVKTEQKDSNYLFDAFVRKETLCDGYTNAYSLLAHMLGLECFEKEYIPDGASGHTWNTVCIEGVFYNVDATISSDTWDGLTELKAKAIQTSSFAFEDKLQYNVPFFNDVLPSCEANLLADIFTTCDEECDAAIITLLHQKDNAVVVSLGQIDPDILQTVANEFGSITYSTYTVTEDYIIYAICVD